MKTKLFQAFMAIGVLGSAVAIPETTAYAQATGSGTVRGQLKDQATG